MGVDATVYCDCYEKGHSHCPPPQPELVYVDQNGQVCFRWDVPGADQDAFYNWLRGACEHGPMNEMISHRLGNVARIGFIRSLLTNSPQKFPILLAKVVYNGTHAGDSLTLDDVERLVPELSNLSTVHVLDAGGETILREFEEQMSELVTAALRVHKPIAF